MNEGKINCVLDTSAWLALIEDEAGADVVQTVLESTRSGAVEILVSFMSFMEVFYITLQEREIEEAQTRVRLMESQMMGTYILMYVTSLPLKCINVKGVPRRQNGYRGSGDEEIYRFAQEEEAILLTGDLGFGNILKFPLGQHFGIVVARFPNEMPPREINKRIVASLKELHDNELKGNLIILEPGRIRIRCAPL